MDFLKVALRADLAAENTSQAAPHAIIHLIGPLSNSTFCGKARVSDVAHAGTDRVVSCPDCLSFARAARDTPADDTSLTEGTYRVLRSVSTPDYTGLERRSRPRFIEADLTIDQLTNGENMKHYTNVIKDDVGSVHALYDGETATACGAINAADTMGSTRAVSCDACMKAIINQQRASDHRMPLLPGPQPVLHHNFSTHMTTWRRAICVAMDAATTEADKSLWLHELKAFDLAYSTLDHSLATGGDDMPKVIHHGGPVSNNPMRYDGSHLAEPQAHGYADQDGSVGVSADAVVEANRKLLLDRSNVGIAKYGVTLEQSGLTLRQFVQHALEETLDLANYLQATLMTTALQEQKQ